MLVIGGSMLTILISSYTAKKHQAEIAVALGQVQRLYQNQVVQYFSARKFGYSLTRSYAWPNFFTARPPRGKQEQLVGYNPEQNKPTPGSPESAYVRWDTVGFPLTQPSYFIYRIEPEPALADSARPGDNLNPFYHFHVMAIGDLDGDGRYSVIMRNAYVDKENRFQAGNQTYTADVME